MNSHGKRRFGRIFVGVLAATLAIPASAAASVQIGGYLVAPSQVSAYQASADLAPQRRPDADRWGAHPAVAGIRLAGLGRPRAQRGPGADRRGAGCAVTAVGLADRCLEPGWIVSHARWAEARFRIRLGRSRHYRSRRTRRARAADRRIPRHAQAREDADDAREHASVARHDGIRREGGSGVGPPSRAAKNRSTLPVTVDLSDSCLEGRFAMLARRASNLGFTCATIARFFLRS